MYAPNEEKPLSIVSDRETNTNKLRIALSNDGPAYMEEMVNPRHWTLEGLVVTEAERRLQNILLANVNQIQEGSIATSCDCPQNQSFYLLHIMIWETASITHWCLDCGMSSHRCHTITEINSDILPIGPPEIKFGEIWIKIQNFELEKMHLNMPSAKRGPICSNNSVLMFTRYRPQGNYQPQSVK